MQIYRFFKSIALKLINNPLPINKNDRFSVAFVCLSAYPLFDKQVQARIGGMETRSALFAKALAQTNRWKTLFAVSDYGQERSVTIDNVELVVYSPFAKRVYDNVVPRFHRYKWRPVIHLDKRDLHFIWHLPVYLLIILIPKCFINRFWRSIKPDVVCCFGNNQTSAEVIADCFRSGINTVLCIASDSDLSSDYKPGNYKLNDYGLPQWMGWYAVNTADYIFVQTQRQQELLEQNFNRQGLLVRNPVQVTAETRLSWPPRGEREFVLWIGRSDTFHKLPLLLLEMARFCPEIPFLMIVNNTNQNVFEIIQRELPSNVTLIERVHQPKIWDYYRRAKVFVSTSAYEGFPNTFLQAAASGTPVVSLSVDPEGILAKHRCGICSDGDFEYFVESVRTLWADRTLAENYAENFFGYVLSHHSLTVQAESFQMLLKTVVSSPQINPGLGCWHRPFTHFVSRGSPE